MNSTGKTLADFKVGQGVTYVPNHAPDLSHPNCEHGEVSSIGTKFVFVRYYRNGMTQHTAEATDPSQLI